jgi:hypothetical protein
LLKLLDQAHREILIIHSNYIEMTHYKLFKSILYTCRVSSLIEFLTFFYYRTIYRLPPPPFTPQVSLGLHSPICSPPQDDSCSVRFFSPKHLAPTAAASLHRRLTGSAPPVCSSSCRVFALLPLHPPQMGPCRQLPRQRISNNKVVVRKGHNGGCRGGHGWDRCQDHGGKSNGD